MKFRFVPLLLFVCSGWYCFGQDYPLTDSLKRELQRATAAEQKIIILSRLASFYMNINNQISEDYGRQQIELAELSRDRNLMAKAQLLNADRYLNHDGSQEPGPG